MHKGFISDNVKITKVKDASAAGQTAIDSTPVDMAGYDGVLFLTHVGAITAGGVQTMKAQQDTAVGMGSAADLEGSSLTIADDDDNQSFFLDIKRPKERFVRVRISRATQDSAFGAIWAIQYRGRTFPVSNNVADTITGEKWESPSEGTA